MFDQRTPSQYRLVRKSSGLGVLDIRRVASFDDAQAQLSELEKIVPGTWRMQSRAMLTDTQPAECWSPCWSGLEEESE